MPLKLIGVIAGVLVVAGIIVAIAAFGTSSGEPDAPPASDKVRIEIRSKPIAKIKMNGKSIGKTPLSIYVPRGTQEITFEALMETQLFTGSGREIREHKTMSRNVLPDRDLLVDFILPYERPEDPPPPTPL